MMGNGIRDQIKDIIEEHVRVQRMMYENGEFVFVYEGTAKAANLILASIYDRLESIDCE
jgi:hypothetical protein